MGDYHIWSRLGRKSSHDLYTEEEQKVYPGAVNTYRRVTICTHYCSSDTQTDRFGADRDLIKYLPDSAGDLGSEKNR